MASSIQKKRIELQDKKLLDPLLRSCALQLSEYSFANLYLFRNVHDYQLVLDRYPYIEGIGYDKTRFIMPTSKECFHYLLEKGIGPLFPIPEEWAKDFEGKVHNPSDSDYIYKTELLATYQGRHLSKKRNLVKQFKELYSCEVRALCPDDEQDVEIILAAWRAHVLEDFDLEPSKEAVVLMKELALEGKIYYIEGKPAGFMMGEELIHELFVLHFAKADISYKGIYQFMYQNFAEGLLQRYPCINMEQDMGIESLRQAKHSYEPAMLAPKYMLLKN